MVPASFYTLYPKYLLLFNLKLILRNYTQVQQFFHLN